MAIAKATSIATIVIHGRGQVVALTWRTSPTHESSDNNASRCFCGPRFSPLSLHAARFRRTAAILSACGPLIASIHAEDDQGDRPTCRDYWSGILGFDLSHNIGVLLFALLIVVTAQYQISWLKPILALVGGAFAVISWRCWFRVPMLGSFIGTALMVVSWVV